MHRWKRRTFGRTAAVTVTAFVLAAGGVGCGSSGDGGGAGGGGATGNDFSGTEAEINEVLVGIQEDFDNLDGASYCDRLTASGHRQVERFGAAFALGKGCVEIIDTVSRNTRATGVKQKPTKLISVKVDGNRAIATVRNGGRPPDSMAFVKDQGEWKVPNPGFSTRIGGDINPKLSSDPAKRFRQVKRARDEVKGSSQSGDGNSDR